MKNQNAIWPYGYLVQKRKIIMSHSEGKSGPDGFCLVKVRYKTKNERIMVAHDLITIRTCDKIHKSLWGKDLTH